MSILQWVAFDEGVKGKMLAKKFKSNLVTKTEMIQALAEMVEDGKLKANLWSTWEVDLLQMVVTKVRNGIAVAIERRKKNRGLREWLRDEGKNELRARRKKL